MTSKKSQLGQFYTTNYGYILSRMDIPLNSHIIEPFAGEGDLLKFAQMFAPMEMESYDVDPKKDGVVQRDTLSNPPDYQGKFVLTNPPYLAKNKHKGDKHIFRKHKQDDLYKCFMSSVVDSGCVGGIVIIPLNFWCSIRKADALLRRRFLNQYTVSRVNVFYEKVFDDTGYTVCSIQFRKRKESGSNGKIPMNFYPDRSAATIRMGEFNNYTIGGDILNVEQTTKFKVQRATKKNKDDPGLTNILVKCIDDTSTSQLGLKIVPDEERFVDETPKLSARSYATLVITPPISMERQKKIVDVFNARMGKWRGEYNSLFLTNYRESNRKRISFGLVFKLVNYLLR
jgi:hypothetical protein